MKDVAIVINDTRDFEFEHLITKKIAIHLVKTKDSSRKITKNKHIVLHDLRYGDLSDIIDCVSQIVASHDRACILNFRESSVLLAQAIARAANLPGFGCADLYLNKLKVKSHLEGACVPFDPKTTPPFPFILKPSNLYSSLFVSLIKNPSDLDFFHSTVHPNYRQYLSSKHIQNSQIVIEPYYEGSLHSIDGVIDVEGNILTTPVVDVFTGEDIGKNDFHHYLRLAPSLLSAEQEAKADAYVRDCFSKLPICPMAFHAEFVYTKDAGPKLIEIAPRPGGNRIKILKKAFGIHFEEFYFEAMSGRCVENTKLHRTPLRTFALITPFAEKRMPYQGSVLSKRSSGIHSAICEYAFVDTGDEIGPVNEGFQNYHYVELENTDRERLFEDLKTIQDIDPFYL